MEADNDDLNREEIEARQLVKSTIEKTVSWWLSRAGAGDSFQQHEIKLMHSIRDAYIAELSLNLSDIEVTKQIIDQLTSILPSIQD